MKKVQEEEVFLTDNSKVLFDKIDFADTFSTTNHYHDIEEISNLVFNCTPKWINALLAIRNRIVKVIGLKTTKPDDYNENYQVGRYLNFFKILFISDNEVIFAGDDSHLNFRAIINRSTSDFYNIKVTTIVQFNNSMGRIYMKVVKPFHKLLLKRMVRNAYVLK